jgi:predicted amidohydrolase
MKIALVQQTATEEREANRERGLAATREAAKQGAQLVCFAELGFTPFYPQRKAKGDVKELAETVPGPTTDAFSRLAAELDVAVVLNLFELDGESTYDSSPVIGPDGALLGKTRMVHVPDYEGFHERDYYAPSGLGAPVYHAHGVTLGIAICYDRHFPEYMRALALAGADLVLVPQAGTSGEWPAGLFEAEMQVAAFQNGYFTALCNRVGTEGDLDFGGESFVCDPDGRVIAQAGQGSEETLICEIDIDRATGSHARRLFLPDRRPELYGDWLRRSGR